MANNNEPLVPIPQNWQQMNLQLPTDILNQNRPARTQVYMPPYDGIPQENIILRNCAIMYFVEGEQFADDNLVHDIVVRLAQTVGGPIQRFWLRPIHPSRNRFLLRCSTTDLRNVVCQIGNFNVRDRVLQFVPWSHGIDSNFERSTFYTKIRVIGVPLNLWNRDGITILTSGFGTPLRVAPHFGPGNLINLTLLVHGCHPVNIPHEIIVGQEPYARRAQVIIEGFIQVAEFVNDALGPGIAWEEPLPQVAEEASNGSAVSDE